MGGRKLHPYLNSDDKAQERTATSDQALSVLGQMSTDADGVVKSQQIDTI